MADLEEIRLIEVKKGTWKLTLSNKKLRKGLYDALFNVVKIHPVSALKNILDSFEWKEDIEYKAFHLIYSALINTCLDSRGAFNTEFKDKVDNLGSKVKGLENDVIQKLEELEIAIDEGFFDRPERALFITAILKIYLNWLTSLGLPENEVRPFLVDWTYYFIKQLRNTWDSDPERYWPLKDHFQFNPFDKATSDMGERKLYYSYLRNQFTNQLLGEKFNLGDIYVEPNFKIYKKSCPKENKLTFDREGFTSLNFKGSIHHYIENHFLKNQPVFGFDSELSRLLILLGQPGQGKSSFCIKTIYSLLTNLEFDKELLFFRLRDLLDSEDFITGPFEELKRVHNKFPYDLKNTLIILDGLDELYVNQGLTDNQIKNQLIYRITNTLKEYKGLYIILTTRYNYIKLDDFNRKEALILSLDGLTLDQQIDWLRKYKPYYPNCQLTQKVLKDINDEQNRQYQHLRELINQPILLQLVARADFDVTQANNRAAIYDKLFEAIINRSWAKGQLKKYEKLAENEDGKADMREYLSAIAFKIHQSNYEYIRKSELLNMPETKRFIADYLDSQYKEIDNALRDILVSFYFKSVEKSGEDSHDADKHANAIEFYHKSLQEFLAAEYIWNKIADAFLEGIDKRGKKRYSIKEWGQALKTIYDLVELKPLSQEVIQYLIEIIGNDTFVNKEELRARLVEFFPELLDYHFLYNYLPEKSGPHPFIKAASCFHLYWTILSHLDTCKGLITKDTRPLFTQLLQSIGIYLKEPHINLAGANLAGANLAGAKLEGANLEGAKLGGAKLGGAKLGGANLEGAYLEGAKLEGANLERANLAGANLAGAKLEGAKLEGANLEGANLGGAYLEGANLVGANLVGANLAGAKLVEAYLVGAKLEGTNLEGANLERANLEGANLVGANLVGAKLVGAKLVEAKLVGAKLEGTNLEGANLEGANLEGANLEGANLEGANLVGAYLVGANLEGANLNSVRGLTVKQLSKVKSLYASMGLDTAIKEVLAKSHPHLFEKPEE